MKIKFKSVEINVTVPKNVSVVTNANDIITDIQIAQETKTKPRKFKVHVERVLARKKKYLLHYWLINQEQQVLNLTNPIVRKNEAIKIARNLINLNNTTIYIVPIKFPVSNLKYSAKLTLENLQDFPKYVLVNNSNN